MVQQDPQLKDKVKLVGVNQGDTEDQVKKWKANIRMPFLILDPDSSSATP